MISVFGYTKKGIDSDQQSRKNVYFIISQANQFPNSASSQDSAQSV